MTIKWLFLAWLFFSTSPLLYAFIDAPLPTTQQTLQYISKYKVLAITEMIRGNIPASIKLAQGILETASGTSALCQNSNNHFGIKCGQGWTGLSYYHWDDEPVKSCFRVYESAEQSYIGHTDFLKSPHKRQRYGFLFRYSNTDYRNWALGLQKAGYATSPTYATQLIAIIEWFELYRYDQLAKQFMSLPKEKTTAFVEYEWLFEHELIENYINHHRYIAINLMHQQQIPASIQLAWAILESKGGSTEVALKANNHFGAECDVHWSGNTHKYWTKEGYLACFKAFSSAEQSYKNQNQDMLQAKQKAETQANNKYLSKQDYRAWANFLYKAHLTPSLLYSQQLLWIIERYELHKLDHIQPATTSLAAVVSSEKKAHYRPQIYINTPPTKSELPPTYNAVRSEPIVPNIHHITFTSIAQHAAHQTQEQQISYDKDKWLFDQHKIQGYIDKYKDIAINEMQRSGMPASISLAQGILESKAGESELAAKANNHFALVCNNSKNTYHLWTKEGEEQCYQRFLHPEQSYAAHTDHLRDVAVNERFQFLFEYLLDADYKAWAYTLQRLGYSNNPSYAAQLIWLIEHYQLQELDKLLPQLEIQLIPTLSPNRLEISRQDSHFVISDTDKIKAYIDRYKHIAVAEMDRSGVPASIKMAQGILESGSGESELATKANNHFGIKCGGDWLGTTHYVWDDEPVKSCFRVYTNAEQCYVEHTEFLRNPKKDYRYGFLFRDIDRTDYKGWANGLQTAGYATSQTYAKKLISLIERYELYKLDHLTLKTTEVSDQELALIFNVQKDAPKYETKSDTFTGLPDVHVPKDVWAHFVTDSVVKQQSDKVFIANNLQTVLAPEGKSLAEIAKQHHIKRKKLIRFNELKGRKVLTGQYLYLHKKHKRYTGNTVRHIVRSGQTMYDIAQYYGIQLKALHKLNKAYRDEEPNTGMQVFLK